MDEAAKKSQDVVRRFAWEIASISVHLEEIRYFWAKALGISGPQWMMVVALADLDKGEGVPVNAVSKMLHLDPSFVTTQSKLHEKKGFIRRKTSAADGSLTSTSTRRSRLRCIRSEEPIHACGSPPLANHMIRLCSR